MSALPEILPQAVASRWRPPGLLAVGGLLAVFVLFWPTFLSMEQIWARSETFAHGYLVFPISLWLIWRQRRELAQLTPHPDARGLLLLAGAGAAWLLADAGSVNVVAQYAFIALLIGMVWTVLGWNVVWAAFFPLMFLFTAVPVGEFLIPPLMDFTADFTVLALQFTGIPVYREGTFFSIPSGDWSVVEGCSGLRYLIASITLGLLYAYLTYRSWTRRLLFTLAAVVVPIFANGGRAYMIVMIAHLSDMKLALGVDHYIYGWVFFGFVMVLLFWVGSFWREDDQPQFATVPQDDERSASSRAAWPLVLAAIGIVGVWPAYAAWLAARPLPAMPELKIEAQGGWQPRAPFTNWTPHWVGADRQLRQSFAQAGRNAMLELDYYVTQRQDAELINSQNFMIRQKDEVWSNVGEQVISVDIAGTPRQVRQARLKSRDGQRLLVWQWNRIGERVTVDDHLAKLVLAFERVRMQRDDGLSVLVATAYDDTGVEVAAATLARFAADMEPAIAAALDRVDGP